MKNININIALVVALLANLASANPIGRLGLDKIVRQFTIKQIKALNQEAPGLTSNPFAKNKKYAESLVNIWQAHVEKGIIPSRQEFAELDNCFGQANHGVLNLSGEGGHTLLKKALDLPDSPQRKMFIKALVDRGAELNVRDAFIMGPEKVLKALVNLPMEASAWTTVKVYRTFLTKNTESKVWKRFNSFKISGLQAQQRLNKVAKVQELYPLVEKDLLAQRAQEQKEKLFGAII